MKILGKSTSEHFDSFYSEIVTQIGEQKFVPSRILGRGYYQFEEQGPKVGLRTDLSRPYFEHQVAHELVHALQRKEGWPRGVTRHPEGSPIAELGTFLVSMVLDLNVEERLKAWSFDSSYILKEQYRNLKKAVLDQNIPSLGSCRWRKGVMMYANASLTQPANKWDELRKLFARRAPHIEIKGEELVSILKGNGWDTAD